MLRGFTHIKLGWFVLLGFVLGRLEILEGIGSRVYVVVVLCVRNGGLVRGNSRIALKFILPENRFSSLNPSDNSDNLE